MSETFTKQNDLNTFYNFIKGSSYLNNNSIQPVKYYKVIFKPIGAIGNFNSSKDSAVYENNFYGYADYNLEANKFFFENSADAYSPATYSIQNITLPAITTEQAPEDILNDFGRYVFSGKGGVITADNTITINWLNFELPITERFIFPWIKETSSNIWKRKNAPFFKFNIEVWFFDNTNTVINYKYIFTECFPSSYILPEINDTSDLTRSSVFKFNNVMLEDVRYKTLEKNVTVNTIDFTSSLIRGVTVADIKTVQTTEGDEQINMVGGGQNTVLAGSTYDGTGKFGNNNYRAEIPKLDSEKFQDSLIHGVDKGNSNKMNSWKLQQSTKTKRELFGLVKLKTTTNTVFRNNIEKVLEANRLPASNAKYEANLKVDFQQSSVGKPTTGSKLGDLLYGVAGPIIRNAVGNLQRRVIGFIKNKVNSAIENFLHPKRKFRVHKAKQRYNKLTVKPFTTPKYDISATIPEKFGKSFEDVKKDIHVTLRVPQKSILLNKMNKLANK